MPQQNTTKQRRERAVENIKKRRDELLQKKQQQQPARGTQPQPQPPQRGTPPPPRTPTVILPDYTERAKKLGELIALYLKGNWNWNDGMQIARQYAPHGTTEAELRAAVLHAAKVQGNVGNLSVRALVQPEVVHPEVNISDLPKQSTLQNVARGLQAPLRSVAAGATQLAGKKNPRGQYGKESGGKPFRAPQSFAESYASDPTFGSALELAFPNLPQWFRVLLGGALDLALDPTNIAIGAKPVKTLVSTAGKKVGSTRAVQKVAQPIKNVVGTVGTQVMHPTAASVAKKQAPEGLKIKTLSELGKVINDVLVYSFTRNVGSDMLDLRKQLDDIIRRANKQGIQVPQAHSILDFDKYIDNLKQTQLLQYNRSGQVIGVGSYANTIDNLLRQDLNDLAQIETQIRATNPELANEVQELITKIGKKSDNWYSHSEWIDGSLLGMYLQGNHSILENQALLDGMWEGARAVYRREIVPRENIINKAIDVWKRTKTVWNPATHTRNFFQNFLFRYLTGDVDATDLLRLPTALRDMMRLRRIIDDLAKQGTNININTIANQYPELADLAFILRLERNKPPLHRILQQGLLPSVDFWDELSLEPMSPVNRQGMLRQALAQHIPTADDTISAGRLAQEFGIPIRELPRNWKDVLLYLPRKIRDVWQEAKADKRSGVGAIFQRAYQAEDVLPALLMHAVRRRKALMAQNPDILFDRSYRMDYTSIPETIGLLNIAALPFFSYQYLAWKGLQQALRRNPERIYNIVAKPIERSTRITQADDEQGVSQAPRFGFKEREMFQVSPTRGVPYSTILPIDPQFAEPLLSLSGWVSRSPITAIARPFVENRDDSVKIVNQLFREFTPATFTHLAYALLGEPQRGVQPVLEHTRGERLLRAIGINIQPIDQMRIARQQQRQAEQQRKEPLYDDPATITGFVKRIMRLFGW